MDCLVLPVTILRRRSMASRLGYRQLNDDGFDGFDGPVTVVVGKEKREFLVEPFVLEENPFRVLISTVKNKKEDDEFKRRRFGGAKRDNNNNNNKRVIFVDVDAILFEHMLWLMQNDCSSLFQLNLKEIIDFYAQDI